MGLKKFKRFLLSCCGGGTNAKEADFPMDNLRHTYNQALLPQPKAGCRGYVEIFEDGQACWGGGRNEKDEEGSSTDDLGSPNNQASKVQEEFACRGYRYELDDGQVVYLRNPPMTTTVSVHCEGKVEDEDHSSGSSRNLEDDENTEKNREMFRDTWGPGIVDDALGDDKSSCVSSSDRACDRETVEGPVPSNSADSYINKDVEDEAHQSVLPKDKLGSMPSRFEINEHDVGQTMENESPRAKGMSEDHLTQLMLSRRRVPRVERTRSTSPHALNIDLDNCARNAVVNENDDEEKPVSTKLLPKLVSTRKGKATRGDDGCNVKAFKSNEDKAAMSASSEPRDGTIPSLSDNADAFWKLLWALTDQLGPLLNPSGPSVTRPHERRRDGCICQHLFPLESKATAGQTP